MTQSLRKNGGFTGHFLKKNCKKMCQNLVPLVNIKIAGKWMFIPLKMVLIGIDPYPNGSLNGMIIRKSMNINEHWTSSNKHWDGKIMKIKPLLEHPGSQVDSNFNGSRPKGLFVARPNYNSHQTCGLFISPQKKKTGEIQSLLPMFSHCSAPNLLSGSIHIPALPIKGSKVTLW